MEETLQCKLIMFLGKLEDNMDGMASRKFSPSELQFIEEVAQERLKFRRILQEQAAIFQTNLPEYHKAMERFKESGKIANRWVPPRSPEKINEYLRKYEELCKPVPHNFDELSQSEMMQFLLTRSHSRVMTMHAAHAATVVLILHKMLLHPGKAISSAINGRIRELNGRVCLLLHLYHNVSPEI